MRLLLFAGGVAAGILLLLGAGFFAMWMAARGWADRALRPSDGTEARRRPRRWWSWRSRWL